MRISTAKRYLKLFVNNGKKIIPKLTDDWKINIEKNKLIILSENLDMKITTANLSKFMKENILNGRIKIDNNKLSGHYAYTIDGFISEEEFFLANDIIENQQTEDIEPFNIYFAKDDNYYIPTSEKNNYSLFSIENNRFIKKGYEYNQNFIKLDKKELFNKYLKKKSSNKICKYKFIEKIDYDKEDIFLFTINFLKRRFIYIENAKEYEILKIKHIKSQILEYNNEYYMEKRDIDGNSEIYKIKDIEKIPNIKNEDSIEDYLDLSKDYSRYYDFNYIHFMPTKYL